MNIDEFMSYRTSCPVCKGFNLKFQMGRYGRGADTHKYEDDRLLVTREMRGIRKGEKSYKISYSFGCKDNSAQIEFYTTSGEKFHYFVPTGLISKFKTLDANLKAHIFTKECRSCNRYSYTSNPFFIYYKAKNIGNLQVQNEYFGLIGARKLDYRIYRMNNNYLNKETSIQFFNSGNIDFALEQCYFNGEPGSILNLDLMKFSSENEMVDRLNNLIVFS